MLQLLVTRLKPNYVLDFQTSGEAVSYRKSAVKIFEFFENVKTTTGFKITFRKYVEFCRLFFAGGVLPIFE